MKDTFFKKISFIGNAIRMGLAMVLPVLFIGSMTVLLNGFPLLAYQDFLDTFLGGALRSILLILQVTTVGALAIYMTIALNISYMEQTEERRAGIYMSLRPISLRVLFRKRQAFVRRSVRILS